MANDLFLIGLEEHYSTPELVRINGLAMSNRLRDAHIDIGRGRIADMDAAGIDMQVLSPQSPGVMNAPVDEGTALARKINSYIHDDIIAAYPDRFRAFATLPFHRPEEAADELERCVCDLGFLGCMSYGAMNGKFLDHASFAPVLARAEALGVPIYIHPFAASPQVRKIYYDGLGDENISDVLSGPGYGWHQEVALQCLRMIASGVFDRFPKLQIVVGHMGEALPFYYWRFGERLAAATSNQLQKPIQQYFHDNVWITTSGFFRNELLTLALAVMGDDRVMFSVDYPRADNKAGADWFRAVDLPAATKNKIAHANAEKLLNIGPF